MRSISPSANRYVQAFSSSCALRRSHSTRAGKCPRRGREEGLTGVRVAPASPHRRTHDRTCARQPDDPTSLHAAPDEQCLARPPADDQSALSSDAAICDAASFDSDAEREFCLREWPHGRSQRFCKHASDEGSGFRRHSRRFDPSPTVKRCEMRGPSAASRRMLISPRVRG